MELLFSDKNIAVCIKPVGLDSEHEVPEKLIEMLGGEIFTLHRLDKNVGGVMVYARNKRTAAELSLSIQQRRMIKEYVAKVHGDVPEQGHWEDFLFKDSRRNKVFVVDKMRAGVKQARLEFVKLSEGLVRIRLHTGRSHQIRVQFASRGYPLVGDHKYGARDDIPFPMLHSCQIAFDYQGKQVQFSHLPQWAVG